MSDPVLRARSALADTKESLDALEAHIHGLRSIADAALASAKESEARASTAKRDRERAEQASQRVADVERRLDELQPKTDRLDNLEEACRKMLSALETLPVSMDKAGIIQTITPPAIPLYGTYEWKAVMNAKFDLIQAMKKEST